MLSPVGRVAAKQKTLLVGCRTVLVGNVSEARGVGTCVYTRVSGLVDAGRQIISGNRHDSETKSYARDADFLQFCHSGHCK